MRIKLTRGDCRAELETIGGELVSYRDGRGTEYIWQGDPAYWSGRNPVLFPIVGALEDGAIGINGAKYRMERHGFARRMEFAPVEQGADYAVLELRDSAATRAQYPFAFRLSVRQQLVDGGFETAFTVENTDKRPMPFCIGAHTAFRCPLYPGEAFSDYVIRFPQSERVPSRRSTPEGYLHPHATDPCLEDDSILPLRYSVFDAADTLTLEGLRSTCAELVNPATGRGVRMEFPGFPMFALWTTPGKNAPYICLEPWHGCAHVVGEGAEFADKHACLTLAPGGSASFSYRVFSL